MINGLQKNLSTYLAIKAHFFDLSSLKDPKEVHKQVSKVFDESDLRLDSERDDLYIYNDETYMAKHPEVAKLKSKKSKQELESLLVDNRISFGLFYGDAYSSQDNLPFGPSSHWQRQRVF